MQEIRREVQMENYKNSKIGLETAQKYGDIIEMERPQTEESLRKHPRMTLQNRAKIFSPDRKSTRLNSSHGDESRMPSSA